MYEFFRTKEEKLGPTSGTTASLWYPAVLSPGVVVSPDFPGWSEFHEFWQFVSPPANSPHERALVASVLL